MQKFCLQPSKESSHHGDNCYILVYLAERAWHVDRLVWHVQVLDEKETAVYKRALEEQYKLKMKASRCARLGWPGICMCNCSLVGSNDRVLHISASSACIR